ncbi:MAG: glycosyltransferase family 2 protein [Candidatus Symbiothrix sp.]|jgi:glycosyltransferase involved in cell wall biosynthesis|nr:glycosyltransferase family 2 protein [Candidatus Symbiothrix sp.]
MTVKFSIIVCTYNRAEYLKRTLQCIVEQTYSPEYFELLIVDNNCSDGTADVCQSFIAQHPTLKIRYLKEKQQGISYARNLGVNEAQGVWIVFLDDDETVKPDFLQQLDDFSEEYLQAELISEPVQPVYETAPPDWMSPYMLRLLTGAYNKGRSVKIVGRKDYPGTGHAVFKRYLFLRYGAFNTDLGRKGNSLMGAEDKDFFLRLIQNNVRCYYVPKAVVFHHIPTSKLSENFFRRIALAVGKSEQVRTLSLSKTAYLKRWFDELVKWGATGILFVYYTLNGQHSKGKKLIEFRSLVSKGLLAKDI